MNRNKMLLPKGCLLNAVALLAFVATTAGTLAAQEPSGLDASSVGHLSAASKERPVLNWLFTWSEKSDDGEEEDKLESDRPDYTEGSSTVGRERLQIESGYTYTQAQGGDPTSNVHDLPELLVRYGVAERLELRLAWDSGMIFDSHRDRDSGRWVVENGSSDLNLGFKYAITKQAKWFPRTGIIVETTAPIGSPAHGSQQVDAGADILYGWDITEKLSLNCSTGNECTREPLDHLARFHQSASVGYDLTEKLRVFNECYVLFCNNAEESRPKYYYDGGFTYLVAPNLQLDWRAGVGLCAVADGFFTGCGLTVRR